MTLLFHTWQMCIGGCSVLVAGTVTVGPASAAAPIFIIASVILLFCARISAVCFLCAKSSAFKNSTTESVVVVVCMLAAYYFTLASNYSSTST